MHTHTAIIGNKNKVSCEHSIDLTQTEILAIKVVNDTFNKITDDSMHDDFVYFKNGAMIMDDLIFMSAMLNTIVDYIDINKSEENGEK